ncbi:hypothetical protein SELMODRAFT_424623 [Selaginella moellendorffii]|uniref:SAM domain-containing protein n=1 Tax=Selaginella moellendorffii TaxID=88036 RepID=D8SQI4_SELML|nr:hypothetical protein SELMODRAFT_424623 [Selaginella moellendorffii]
MQTLEEYLGNGVLAGSSKIFTTNGYDDVHLLTSMTKNDMKSLGLTKQQQNALELRAFLDDHGLFEYADALEATGKTLALRRGSSSVLSTRYGMKKGHASRFMEQENPLGDPKFTSRGCCLFNFTCVWFSLGNLWLEDSTSVAWTILAYVTIEETICELSAPWETHSYSKLSCLVLDIPSRAMLESVRLFSSDTSCPFPCKCNVLPQAPSLAYSSPVEDITLSEEEIAPALFNYMKVKSEDSLLPDHNTLRENNVELNFRGPRSRSKLSHVRSPSLCMMVSQERHIQRAADRPDKSSVSRASSDPALARQPQPSKQRSSSIQHSGAAI